MDYVKKHLRSSTYKKRKDHEDSTQKNRPKDSKRPQTKSSKSNEKDLLKTERGQRRVKRESSKSRLTSKNSRTSRNKTNVKPRVKNKDIVKERKNKLQSKNKRKQKSPKRENATQNKFLKLEFDLNTYSKRLAEELEIGITLNNPVKTLSDYEVDKALIELMKGVTINPSVASNMVINPLITLCKNLITQNTGPQEQVWDACREYLRTKLESFEEMKFDSTPIKKPFLPPKEILQKLDEDCPLKYCVEREFYGAKKTDLRALKLPRLNKYYEDDYYCNEIIFDQEKGSLNSLYEEQRVNYGGIIQCLVSVCKTIQSSIKSQRLMTSKINNEKEKLQDLDKKRLRIKNKIDQIRSSTSNKFNFIPNERVKNLASFVDQIKDADLLDLCYISEIIEEEKKNKQELSKQHAPLKKFMNKPEQEGFQAKPDYSVSMTLADHFQKESKIPSTFNILKDRQKYIQNLKRQKELDLPPKREQRNKVKIYIVDHDIGKMYKNVPHIPIKNPRNPMKVYDHINYSDDDDISIAEIHDLSNRDKHRDDDDSEEVKNAKTPKRIREYNQMIYEKLQKGPTIVINKEGSSEMGDTGKAILISQNPTIDIINPKGLDQLRPHFLKNLKRIAAILHGSYATDKEIVDLLCSKCILSEEELLPDLWSICNREKRLGDDKKRFYVNDKILRHLGISHDRGILLARDKNKTTPDKDKADSYKFWVESKPGAKTVKKPVVKLGQGNPKTPIKASNDSKIPKTVRKQEVMQTPVFNEEVSDGTEYEVV
ncbi:unnamed protein product [Moneuplotes crassus]|uniref:Uncharacterized protein n=1 Tax=Euplotes crassus TaxID=5936 RepID=A0AAD1Y885_EUPCR|nr:unnamed protein product [Moneuplotes crassus]